MVKHLLSIFILTLTSAIGFAQCYKFIPNTANVVNTVQTVNGGFTAQWICPGDTLHSDGGIMFIFIEPGAIMTTGGGIDTIFVKNGGKLIMNGGIHVIYFESGAILQVSGGIPTYDTCVTMVFDYTNAPPNGCITSTNSIAANEIPVSLFPNPSNGKFTVSVGENKKARLEIYNVLSEKVFESEIFNTKTDIDLNSKSGIYFYRVIENEKIISSGKLVIE